MEFSTILSVLLVQLSFHVLGQVDDSAELDMTNNLGQEIYLGFTAVKNDLNGRCTGVVKPDWCPKKALDVDTIEFGGPFPEKAETVKFFGSKAEIYTVKLSKTNSFVSEVDFRCLKDSNFKQKIRLGYVLDVSSEEICKQETDGIRCQYNIGNEIVTFTGKCKKPINFILQNEFAQDTPTTRFAFTPYETKPTTTTTIEASTKGTTKSQANGTLQTTVIQASTEYAQTDFSNRNATTSISFKGEYSTFILVFFLGISMQI